LKITSKLAKTSIDQQQN